MDELNVKVNTLRYQIELLGRIQMLIVDKLAHDDRDFMNQFIMTALSDKNLRTGFTDFLFKETDAPDTIKTQMMEINELFKQMEEE